MDRGDWGVGYDRGRGHIGVTLAGRIFYVLSITPYCVVVVVLTRTCNGYVDFSEAPERFRGWKVCGLNTLRREGSIWQFGLNTIWP